MSKIMIDDLTDPQINVYQRHHSGAYLARQGVFICEGLPLVERLFASRFKTQSVLTTASKQFDIALSDDIPHYIIADELLGTGYKTGIYACGLRQPNPPLDTLLMTTPKLLMVLPHLTTPRNMGSIVRICAAMGVTALIIGEHCTDPFHRPAIRSSMGAIFSLPCYRSPNMLATLDYLKQQQIHLIASVLDKNADNLYHIKRPTTQDLALLMGNERDGLPPAIINQCNQCVTLPMHNNTDSLNVSIASALFLYEYQRITE